MGLVQWGIPEDLARSLIEELGLQLAIETGTYHGGTARFLSTLVDEVWTVESDADLHRVASTALADLPQVHVLLGSSDTVLEQLAPQFDRPALYWLDAHALPDEVVADSASSCPLLEELDALRAAPALLRSCLLIDDARVFFGPHIGYEGREWPAFGEVYERLGDLGFPFVTVLDDVIIAVPLEGRAVVERWWLEQSRRRGGLEFHQAQMLEAMERPSVAAGLLWLSLRSTATRGSRRGIRTVRLATRARVRRLRARLR